MSALPRMLLPPDLIRHVLAWSKDTARDVACARGVCKAWAHALSTESLARADGLACVSVVERPCPRGVIAALPFGVRTTTVHMSTEIDDDTRASVDDLLHTIGAMCPALRVLNLELCPWCRTRMSKQSPVGARG
jgi:hypothetical protein